ncbi:hypothetical protein BU25DRAFT_415323 [Macroventuria anomochaeta]|uniref:Uncharacterized protein n=1 Tax=Macroventuria anomochaeta TaxID=301207 RepID=A0ACB6RKT5_9PLEO|nr:uncharacterized protein BU25DRAFT_415323 [Macroventuria anomochaeta]KAF2622384.1 hypothetical protein BU25DRAFT_415323 [Macroventuria anomochaeta]
MNVPALYISAMDDAVCKPEAAEPLVEKGLLPNHTKTELIDAGYWVPYEKLEEAVDRLKVWLEEKFLH